MVCLRSLVVFFSSFFLEGPGNPSNFHLLEEEAVVAVLLLLLLLLLDLLLLLRHFLHVPLQPEQLSKTSVAQLGLVRVLPDLCQDHRRVEAEEDAQWKRHSLDHGPGLEAKEVALEYVRVSEGGREEQERRQHAETTCTGLSSTFWISKV